MADDTVQLTDLEVIQQFSLAVRGATATRSEVIAALEADLAYLQGATRRTSAARAEPLPKAETPATTAVPSKPEAKAPVKKAAKKAPAKAARATKA